MGRRRRLRRVPQTRRGRRPAARDADDDGRRGGGPVQAGAFDTGPQRRRDPVGDRRALRLRPQRHQQRYPALDRADTQQDRDPGGRQFLQDRPGQDGPVPRRAEVRQPHDHRQQRPGARLEAQHTGLRRRVLRRDAALREVREEVAAAARRQLLLLPRLHEDHGQHAGRTLRRHPVHGEQRARDPDQDHPGPHRARAGAAARYVDHHRVRGRFGLALAAQPLPHLERVRARVPGRAGGRVQQLPVGGLQEDRVAREVGQDAQHLRDATAAQQGLRTAPVDLLGPLEQGVVTVDDLGVDLFGDRDEGDLPVQLDQGQSRRARRLHERRGQPGEARSQLDDQRGDAPVREAAYEGPLFGGTGAEAEPRGQQQLAALEQGGDVGHLARVHPADGAAQSVGARHHLRQAAAQPRQLQCPLNRDPALVVHVAGRYQGVRPAGCCG